MHTQRRQGSTTLPFGFRSPPTLSHTRRCPPSRLPDPDIPKAFNMAPIPFVVVPVNILCCHLHCHFFCVCSAFPPLPLPIPLPALPAPCCSCSWDLQRCCCLLSLPYFALLPCALYLWFQPHLQICFLSICLLCIPCNKCTAKLSIVLIISSAILMDFKRDTSVRHRHRFYLFKILALVIFE